MHIILHQPEIPANTGNIGRTCAATGVSLHLIEPLGFRLNEKEIRRAGMDYWEHLDVTRYMNFDEFKSMHPDAKSGWLPPKPDRPIRRFLTARMILSCSAKKAPASPKNFWWTMKKHASAFPCSPRYVPLIFPIPWPLSSMKPCASKIFHRCSLRVDFTG